MGKTKRITGISRAFQSITDSQSGKHFDPKKNQELNENFKVLIASKTSLRKKSYELAYDIYHEIGLTSAMDERRKSCISSYDLRKRTLTLLIKDFKGNDAATVTLYFDSNYGLPCDEIFSNEVIQLRNQNRKLCEVARWAIKKEYSYSKKLLIGIFNMITIYARRVQKATDLVIEVHPRHVPFYKRLLLFQEISESKPCPRVNGSPAILLRLDFDLIDKEISRAKEEIKLHHKIKRKDLMGDYCSFREELAIADFLTKYNKPMTREQSNYFGLTSNFELESQRSGFSKAV